MPSRSRRDIVNRLEVGLYHCTSRCVRRALLCGMDPVTGKDYSHRRGWIVECEQKLAGLFAIEIAFHAEMANHLHVVVRLRPDIVATWSDEEVARRWLSISLLAKSRDGTIREVSDARIRMTANNPERIKELRERLADPSHFMGVLCEHMARRCNAEDGCTGHFWEDRYFSRALYGSGAVLSCGIYIDLNQLRAGEAATPETSCHTSAHDRIVTRQEEETLRQKGLKVVRPRAGARDSWLCELTLVESSVQATDKQLVSSATGKRASDKGLLPIPLDNYLELLDATGRMVREGKPGAIPDHLAPILERLGINTSHWSDMITHYQEWFGTVVGTAQCLAERAAAMGARWLRGQKRCAQVFG